jgi:hypothetical protein
MTESRRARESPDRSEHAPPTYPSSSASLFSLSLASSSPALLIPNARVAKASILDSTSIPVGSETGFAFFPTGSDMKSDGLNCFLFSPN